MKHKLHNIYIVLLAIALLSSCKTNFEYPGDDPVDPTLVNLELSVDIDFSEVLYYEPYYKSSSEATTYLSRTMIEVYKSSDLTTPLFRDTHYSPFSVDGTVDIDVIYQVNAIEYTVAIWSDIVEEGSKEDLFFTTELLSSIKNIEPYSGNSDLKNSFSDLIEVDLREYRDMWNITHHCDATMERPLARYEIWTNDLLLFVSEQSKSSPQETVDITTYDVELSYDGYMPFGYDVFSDTPNEARQSISYTSKIEILSDSTARIGFDHIFVNHTETKVNVSIVVYNSSGEVITGVEGITIPLLRDMNTIIIDDYLTRDYNPGIGIDPSFEGDINITI